LSNQALLEFKIAGEPGIDEEFDTSQKANNDAWMQATTDAAKRGPYGAELYVKDYNNTVYGVKNLSPTIAVGEWVYTGFWMCGTGAIDAEAVLYSIDILDAVGDTLWYASMTPSNTVTIKAMPGYSVIGSFVLPSAPTWIVIGVKRSTNGGTGGLTKCWIDGALAGTKSNFDNYDETASLTSIRVRSRLAGSSTSGVHLYFDDILITEPTTDTTPPSAPKNRKHGILTQDYNRIF